ITSTCTLCLKVNFTVNTHQFVFHLQNEFPGRNFSVRDRNSQIGSLNACQLQSRRLGFKKTTLTRFASFLFGVLILVALIYYVRADAVERIIAQINPAVIVVMVGLQVLGWAFYAGAWYVLIRTLGNKLRFLTCQGITFASIFVNYI